MVLGHYGFGNKKAEIVSGKGDLMMKKRVKTRKNTHEVKKDAEKFCALRILTYLCTRN